MEINQQDAVIIGALFDIAKAGDMSYDLDDHGIDYDEFKALEQKIREAAIKPRAKA